jgi:hypothetical protein
MIRLQWLIVDSVTGSLETAVMGWLCCELAAFRLLFAHLCNHSAAEGVRSDSGSV